MSASAASAYEFTKTNIRPIDRIIGYRQNGTYIDWMLDAAENFSLPRLHFIWESVLSAAAPDVPTTKEVKCLAFACRNLFSLSLHEIIKTNPPEGIISQAYAGLVIASKYELSLIASLNSFFTSPNATIEHPEQHKWFQFLQKYFCYIPEAQRTRIFSTLEQHKDHPAYKFLLNYDYAPKKIFSPKEINEIELTILAMNLPRPSDHNLKTLLIKRTAEILASQSKIPFLSTSDTDPMWFICGATYLNFVLHAVLKDPKSSPEHNGYRQTLLMPHIINFTRQNIPVILQQIDAHKNSGFLDLSSDDTRVMLNNYLYKNLYSTPVEAIAQDELFRKHCKVAKNEAKKWLFIYTRCNFLLQSGIAPIDSYFFNVDEKEEKQSPAAAEVTADAGPRPKAAPSPAAKTIAKAAKTNKDDQQLQKKISLIREDLPRLIEKLEIEIRDLPSAEKLGRIAKFKNRLAENGDIFLAKNKLCQSETIPAETKEELNQIFARAVDSLRKLEQSAAITAAQKPAEPQTTAPEQQPVVQVVSAKTKPEQARTSRRARIAAAKAAAEKEEEEKEKSPPTERSFVERTRSPSPQKETAPQPQAQTPTGPKQIFGALVPALIDTNIIAQLQERFPDQVQILNAQNLHIFDQKNHQYIKPPVNFTPVLIEQRLLKSGDLEKTYPEKIRPLTETQSLKTLVEHGASASRF